MKRFKYLLIIPLLACTICILTGCKVSTTVNGENKTKIDGVTFNLSGFSERGVSEGTNKSITKFKSSYFEKPGSTYIYGNSNNNPFIIITGKLNDAWKNSASVTGVEAGVTQPIKRGNNYVYKQVEPDSYGNYFATIVNENGADFFIMTNGISNIEDYVISID